MHFSFDERGKIFVGGLSWDTTHGTMLEYFSRYGDVIDCVVMKNPMTGRSRGFGFVKFKDPDCVDQVLAASVHMLDGRQIDPKSCNPRSLNKGGRSNEHSSRKIFIGGLPINVRESDLKEKFSLYGSVSEAVIMFDQQKQRSRGFGFLTFDSEDSVDRVTNDRFIQIGGKQVEVKRAEPRDCNGKFTLFDLSPSSLSLSSSSSSYLPSLLSTNEQQPLNHTANLTANQNRAYGGQVEALTNENTALQVGLSNDQRAGKAKSVISFPIGDKPTCDLYSSNEKRDKSMMSFKATQAGYFNLL